MNSTPTQMERVERGLDMIKKTMVSVARIEGSDWLASDRNDLKAAMEWIEEQRKSQAKEKQQ